MTATLKQAGKLIGLADSKELTDKQLQVAIGSGFLTDVFEAARRGTLDISKREAIQKLLGLDILTFLMKIKVSGAKRFSSAQCFCRDNVDGVKFSKNLDFRGRLFDRDYVEENVPEAQLVLSILTQPAAHKEILKAGVKRIFLTYLWELLKRQPKGEEPDGKDKVLRVDGDNIFYTRTKWEVNVIWFPDGWHMCGNHISEKTLRWNGHNLHVFSSDSEPQKS